MLILVYIDIGDYYNTIPSSIGISKTVFIGIPSRSNAFLCGVLNCNSAAVETSR